MRTKLDPGWKSIVEGWKSTQMRLRRKLVISPLRPVPRFVAGADAAFSADKSTVFAAAVVYDRIDRKIVEIAHATAEAEFPYVPGFLSFREGPAILMAVRKLSRAFDVICFDGQGYAHPRRCGVAAHLAIMLDRPGIGVAKSRLIGSYEEPKSRAGSFTALLDGPEQIGIVLRTRDHAKPLFVSVGHRVDLESAREIVLACCDRYRVPEPTRQADIEVGRLKQSSIM